MNKNILYSMTFINKTGTRVQWAQIDLNARGATGKDFLGGGHLEVRKDALPGKIRRRKVSVCCPENTHHDLRGSTHAKRILWNSANSNLCMSQQGNVFATTKFSNKLLSISNLYILS